MVTTHLISNGRGVVVRQSISFLSSIHLLQQELIKRTFASIRPRLYKSLQALVYLPHDQRLPVPVSSCVFGREQSEELRDAGERAALGYRHHFRTVKEGVQLRDGRGNREIRRGFFVFRNGRVGGLRVSDCLLKSGLCILHAKGSDAYHVESGRVEVFRGEEGSLVCF